MTVEGWEACDDPERMLGLLGDRVSGRRLRLFAAACCGRAAHLLPDAPSREALQEAWRMAEGADPADRWPRRRLLSGMAAPLPDRAARMACLTAYWALAREHREAARQAASTAALVPRAPGEAPSQARAAELRAVAALLRCVVGNPFRPIGIDAAWLTPAVVSLARAAYDEPILPSGELDPQRLAVLADALEEAGAGAEALAHLRGPGPHARGCHVVDACLGLA
jgi:hypothetical protein